MTAQDVMDAARSFCAACDAAWLLAKDDAERSRVENLFHVGMDAVLIANKHALEALNTLVLSEKGKQ